jgi:hypothetical protein
MLIRSARRERVGRRPLLCRSSIVWLAACLMLGTFCFGGAAWFSSVPDRPTRSAVPTSSRVTYVTKNIEDVRKGETVVAWDPVTGELGRHEVTNTFERTSDHLRVLEFAAEDDGQTQTLETTDEHPFWSVEAEDFVAAGDLRPGDRFISPAGEFSRLVATHRDEHPEGVAVYNFEVADVHNYYVRGHGLRGPPIRVHNASIFGCASAPKGGLERANPADIRFTQDTVSPNFSKGGTLTNAVNRLRSGKLSADDFPAIRVVEHNGKLYSLDNRRLSAFKAAQLDDIPIQRLDLADSVVRSEFLKKFNPINDGLYNIVVPKAGRAFARSVLREFGRYGRN